MKRLAAFVVLSIAAGGAFAHGNESHGSHKAATTAEQKSFGIASKQSKAARTIEISMSDQMRFTPAELHVRQGETVRFVVRNAGKIMHELVLGTPGELQKHAEMMRKFPDMEHDEPHMVHVRPSGRGEFFWTFNRVGEFQYACLIPGHFEAGMMGKIRVTSR